MSTGEAAALASRPFSDKRFVAGRRELHGPGIDDPYAVHRSQRAV